MTLFGKPIEGGIGSVFSRSISARIDEFRAKSQKYLVSVVRSNLNARTKRIRDHRDLENRAFTRDGDVVPGVVRSLGDVPLKEFIYYLIEEGKYEQAKAIIPSDRDYLPFRHLRVQLEYRLGAPPEAIIEMIEQNVKHYESIKNGRHRKLTRTWAVDLQLWGIILIEQGLYEKAIERYRKSLEVQVLPATLYNIFCAYCRQGKEEQAIEALQDLKTRVDLREYLDLVNKFKYDVACDQFRDREWFQRFLRDYSVVQTNKRGVYESCQTG